MELTPEQQLELTRRYQAKFEETGDTLTFHQMYEVRTTYFNELREKAAVKPKQVVAEPAAA